MKKSQFKVGDRVRVVNKPYSAEALRGWVMWPQFVISRVYPDAGMAENEAGEHSSYDISDFKLKTILVWTREQSLKLQGTL